MHYRLGSQKREAADRSTFGKITVRKKKEEITSPVMRERERKRERERERERNIKAR